jgi:hypothetical protein
MDATLIVLGLLCYGVGMMGVGAKLAAAMTRDRERRAYKRARAIARSTEYGR